MLGTGFLFHFRPVPNSSSLVLLARFPRRRPDLGDEQRRINAE